MFLPFNSEQDAVGESAKPEIPIEEQSLAASSSRLEKLDSLIDAEHIEAKKETVNPKYNVISRDRAQLRRKKKNKNSCVLTMGVDIGLRLFLFRL